MRSTLYCLIVCLGLVGTVLAQQEGGDVVATNSILDGSLVNVDSQQAASALPLTTDIVTPDNHKLEKRLVELEDNCAAMQSRIEQLEQKFFRLTEIERHDVKVKNADGFYGKIQQYVDSTRNYLGAQVFMVIIAGTIILLLALLVYLIVGSAAGLRARTSPMASYFATAMRSDDDIDNADDFSSENSEDEMNNQSKLNLARAYIDMEDYSKASTLLHEVITKGNSTEQEEAKKLVDKIKHG